MHTDVHLTLSYILSCTLSYTLALFPLVYFEKRPKVLLLIENLLLGSGKPEIDNPYVPASQVPEIAHRCY